MQRGSPVQTCFKPLKNPLGEATPYLRPYTLTPERIRENTRKLFKRGNRNLCVSTRTELRVVVDDRLQSGRADWKILRSRYSRIATLSSTYLYVWTKFSL